jgi:hypothetical protein
VPSSPRTLSAAGGDALYPQVAVDVAGDAAFTWYRWDGTNYRVQARAVSASGAMSPVRTLSAAGQMAYSPDVDVDAAGNAVFTWYRRDGFNWRVQACTLSAAGVLGPVLTLSGVGLDATFAQLAVDPAGDTVIGWRQFDGANYRVMARTLSAAGALGAVSTLSNAGQDAWGPQIGIDATGAALATWQRYDGAVNRIQYAAGP